MHNYHANVTPRWRRRSPRFKTATSRAKGSSRRCHPGSVFLCCRHIFCHIFIKRELKPISIVLKIRHCSSNIDTICTSKRFCINVHMFVLTVSSFSQNLILTSCLPRFLIGSVRPLWCWTKKSGWSVLPMFLQLRRQTRAKAPKLLSSWTTTRRRKRRCFWTRQLTYY